MDENLSSHLRHENWTCFVSNDDRHKLAADIKDFSNKSSLKIFKYLFLLLSMPIKFNEFSKKRYKIAYEKIFESQSA